MLVLPKAWASQFHSNENAFQFFLKKEGEIFRHHKNRITKRIQYQNQFLFVKTHEKTGWLEIFKNIFSFKKPIISAKNEWDALKKLEALQIPTLTAVAYGECGCHPATKKSFLITEELAPHISLDRLFKEWKKDRSRFSLKQSLIKKIALIAKTIHEHGLNHRDFYLCHFIVKTDKLLNDYSPVYLIDLHRAQMRKQVPVRWKIKDLSGLYFSAMETGLSQRDCFRFLKNYFEQPSLRTLFKANQKYLNKIHNKAMALYKKIYGRTCNNDVTVTHKLGNYKAVYLQHYESTSLIRFLHHPESAFHDESKFLKRGDTTSVVLTPIDNHYYLVKRYNVLGLWGAFKRSLTCSRASRCWTFSHYLKKINVDVPQAVAYVEKKWGPFRQETYFICDYIPSVNALTFFKNNQGVDAKTMANHIIEKIKILFRENITHGDLKATNILLSNGKIYFIDLDAMRFHASRRSFARACSKDISRWMRNWKEYPEVVLLFSEIASN